LIDGWQVARQVLRRHFREPRGHFNCNGGGGAQAAECPGEAREGSWTASAAGTGDAMPQSGGRVTGGGYALLCGARRAFEL